MYLLAIPIVVSMWLIGKMLLNLGEIEHSPIPYAAPISNTPVAVCTPSRNCITGVNQGGGISEYTEHPVTFEVPAPPAQEWAHERQVELDYDAIANQLDRRDYEPVPYDWREDK